MSTISYPQLVAACEPGGATVLSLVTELAPAGGAHAGIAPARYVADRSEPTSPDQVLYQARFVDGQPVLTVIIDQEQSQLNRVEAAILQCIRDEQPPLSQVPRVQVSYDSYDHGRTVYTDLELPHRVFDGQIRAGTIDGMPVTAHSTYQAVRDASAADARILLEVSPGSLLFGAWDSTRKIRQSRYRSALAGEIIGVLADQRDGVWERVAVSTEVRQPPGGVSCSRIIRTQVLSFAVLRQLRFDSGPAGDAACRALLAAYALAGLARANAELIVRAGCDLVEDGPTSMKLDARNGAFVALDPPSIEQAEELLERALEAARREADIQWRGQVFAVTGDPVYTAAGTGEPDGGQVGHAPRAFWRPMRSPIYK